MKRWIGMFGMLVVASMAAVAGARAQGENAGHSLEQEAVAAGSAISCPSYAGWTGTPIETVRYLAADALEGRFSGSAGERCAGDFIASAFAALGLEPAGEDGYFQSLPLASVVTPHAPVGTGRNVIAVLPGADPDLAASLVIVGAHYDHLGLGEFGSTGEAGQIHNGADDNASGVAAMLEAARILTSGPRPGRSILFMAFTGEELGLIGSSYYTKNPTRPLEETLAMVNLDMVGRLEGGTLIVSGTGTAPEWQQLIPSANDDIGIDLAYDPSGYGPSDHTSFYSSDIPVLHLFTNVHADYHRDTDDWERIDGDGLIQVARLTANIAGLVANRPTRLTLIPGVGEQAAGTATGSGAWLGTVPDFTPVDHGVLLSGVTAGSPGDAAGLRKGDILVGIGEAEVATLQDFSDILRRHKPGDDVVLRFLRDGEAHEVSVRLGDRADRPE